MKRKCSRCGVMFEPEPGDTHKTCPHCREYRKLHRDENNQANRERYAFYREHGICITCGQTWAEPGRTRCMACQKKQKAYKNLHDPNGNKQKERNRVRKEARMEAGLCVDCGRKAEPGSCRCRRCINMRMDSTRKYNIMKRIKREADKLRNANAR